MARGSRSHLRCKVVSTWGAGVSGPGTWWLPYPACTPGKLFHALAGSRQLTPPDAQLTPGSSSSRGCVSPSPAPPTVKSPARTGVVQPCPVS